MKNVLKALLMKNQLTNDPTDYKAQVIVKGNLGMSDIVDELIKEGLKIDKETVIDILSQYNQKSANLVLSGYNVNNGLVNMRSSIRGSLYQGKWNPNINWVDVSVSQGAELYQAVVQTNVEIIGEKDESLEIRHLSEQINQFTGSSQSKFQTTESIGTRLKPTTEPACGMAFRNWLCKA